MTLPRFSPYAWCLIGICIFALAVRVPTIGYGLPYHLYGDEETNVYGALEMLQLHTLLPALHPAEFNNIFYEPPVTAYIFAAAFIPTIALDYLMHGMPSLAAFKAMLTIDPSIFWYVARSIEVAFSIASIVLVYSIGKMLFKQERAALLSAAFYATSFTATTLAATARHWTIGVFFMLAALACALAAFERGRPRERYLVWGGVLLGLCFGASYLVCAIPLALLIILWRHGWHIDRASVESVLGYFLPAAAVALLTIAVAPWPFFAQVLYHVVPAGQRSWSAFFSYYGYALWQYEAPLAIFATLGALMLLYARRALALLFGVFFVGAIVLMYYFMPNLARYLLPLIPLLALMAGYGLAQISTHAPYRQVVVPLLALILLIYTAAVYGRYEVLMLRNDTSVDALQWIERNIPTGSSIIVESDTMHFYATQTSLAAEARIWPARLRSNDRALLGGAITPPGTPVYNVYPFSSTDSTERAAMLAYIHTHPTAATYLISGWSVPAYPLSGFSQTLVKNFPTGAEYRATALFVGGNVGGEPAQDPRLPLLDLLYHTQYLGADIAVYRL